MNYIFHIVILILFQIIYFSLFTWFSVQHMSCKVKYLDEWLFLMVISIKSRKIKSRHGIPCKHASVPCGRYVSGCRRKCGMHSTQVSFFNGFNRSALFPPLFRIFIIFNAFIKLHIILNRIKITRILGKPVDSWFLLAEQLYRILCLKKTLNKKTR